MQTADLDTVVGLMQELFSEDPLPDQLAFDSVQARSALEGLVRDPLYGRAWVI